MSREPRILTCDEKNEEIMITIEKERLCIVGDIHGEINSLVYDISERYGFLDTAFIIVGDVGLGFNQPGWYDAVYSRNRERLEGRGNIIYGIRGNHDDPEFFNGDKKLDFPSFKTISDYEPLEWKGKIILPIGGATSVDKKDRLVENYKWKKKGSNRKCWWPDERPVKLENLESLPGHIDIIVSHEAPAACGPVLIREEWMDGEMFENIKEDREYLYKILKEKVPERWYFGHHHESYSGTCVNTLYRGLGIQEIVEVIYYED